MIKLVVNGRAIDAPDDAFATSDDWVMVELLGVHQLAVAASAIPAACNIFDFCVTVNGRDVDSSLGFFQVRRFAFVELSLPPPREPDSVSDACSQNTPNRTFPKTLDERVAQYAEVFKYLQDPDGYGAVSRSFRRQALRFELRSTEVGTALYRRGKEVPVATSMDQVCAAYAPLCCASLRFAS